MEKMVNFDRINDISAIPKCESAIFQSDDPLTVYRVRTFDSELRIIEGLQIYKEGQLFVEHACQVFFPYEYSRVFQSEDYFKTMMMRFAEYCEQETLLWTTIESGRMALWEIDLKTKTETCLGAAKYTQTTPKAFCNFFFLPERAHEVGNAPLLALGAVLYNGGSKGLLECRQASVPMETVLKMKRGELPSEASKYQERRKIENEKS